MGRKRSKRPLPSYEEGKLRDPSIKKMQDTTYQHRDLTHLIKKAVKGKASEGA